MTPAPAPGTRPSIAMPHLLSRLRTLSETVMLRHAPLFWFWIAVNLVGLVWGTVGWYGSQLAETSPLWWLFVPDCPLVAGLFAIALWGLRDGRRWTGFNLWVAMGLIKYGIWTCVIWLAYWSQTGDFFPLSVAMFLTHIGLIAQGIVLLLLTRSWTMVEALPALAYYLVADAVDYGLGHHPGYPRVVSAALVQWHTMAVTLILGLLLVARGRSPARPPTKQARPIAPPVR